MRSRGFTRAVLAGQEIRVAWFHNVIDEYMAGTRPVPSTTAPSNPMQKEHT